MSDETRKKLGTDLGGNEPANTDLVGHVGTEGVPAIVIPRRHQSAPKMHWSEIEIRKVAKEIQSGNYVIPAAPEDEFFNYGPTQILARHPRMIEAFERMEREKEEAKGQEAVEKAEMLHEMMEMAARKDQWDGQNRWIGKVNEEMRVVNIITPFTFMAKLRSAGILENRVRLNTFAVLGRAALLAPELDLMKGERREVQVGTLQYPCGPEWMVMRFDEYGVPTTAKYLGWRTALLSMISLGVITEKEAHKAFPLGSGPAGDWYRQQLKVYRANKREENKYAN